MDPELRIIHTTSANTENGLHEPASVALSSRSNFLQNFRTHQERSDHQHSRAELHPHLLAQQKEHKAAQVKHRSTEHKPPRQVKEGEYKLVSGTAPSK